MLVTLEGIDGAGKTTAWEALRADYGDARADGETAGNGRTGRETGDEWGSVVFTREPTDSWYGDAVNRSIADPDADPLAELFLYTADHAAHLARTVRPALGRGDHVVSDRYSDSRYAYQSVALDDVLDDPLAFVQAIHRPWTHPPDCTVYLDADPATAASRSARGNKFEREAFLARVHDAYERLVEAEPERFVRVDANRNEAAVVDAVREAVESRLG